jgi:hypothetical protein
MEAPVAGLVLVGAALPGDKSYYAQPADMPREKDRKRPKDGMPDDQRHFWDGWFHGSDDREPADAASGDRTSGEDRVKVGTAAEASAADSQALSAADARRRALAEPAASARRSYSSEDTRVSKSWSSTSPSTSTAQRAPAAKPTKPAPGTAGRGVTAPRHTPTDGPLTPSMTKAAGYLRRVLDRRSPPA